MPNVIFAYNTTSSIPSAGAQRVTYNAIYARDDIREVQGEFDNLGDYSGRETFVGSKLILRFKIGATILRTAANRTFFTSFFTAKHRWAVYGDFKDTANSGNDNLCKCNLIDRRIEVSVDYDQEEGYELISEKVF